MTDTFDDIVARIARIEESLQLADCPPLDGCTPHAEIPEDQKHTPRLHASVGEHGEAGRDPLRELAILTGDVEIRKDGPRFIFGTGAATDPNRWSWTHSPDGEEVYLQYFDIGSGTWITVATFDKDGNFRPEGGIDIDIGDIEITGDPACMIWTRTVDGDQYRACATPEGLEIDARPGGTGNWQQRVLVPRDGWSQGDLLAADATGAMLPFPLGPENFGLASSPSQAQGLTWRSFGTPADQVPGIVPIGCWMPYGGDSDPGVQPDGSVYLLADGRPLLEPDYPVLFTVFGYKFGGSGSTFNLPDMADRLPLGADRRPVGEVGGSWEHLHDVNQIPEHGHGVTVDPHSHTVNSHVHDFDVPAHTHGPGTLTAPAHTHPLGGNATVTVPAHTHGPGTLAGTVAEHDHAAQTQGGSLSVNVPNHTHTTQIGQLVIGTSGSDGPVLIPSQSGGSNFTSSSAGGATVNVGGATGTRAPACSINSGATASGGGGAATVGGSTQSGGGGTVTGASASGGAHAGSTGPATPGTNAATVDVTVDAAGVPNAQTETQSHEPQVLACNYVVRVA